MKKKISAILLLIATLFIVPSASAIYFNDAMTYNGQVTINNQPLILEEIAAQSGTVATNTGWLYVTDDGLYFKDETGAVTAIGANSTAWDDIGDPDAAGTIAMTTYQQILTSTKTNDDMFLFQGLGSFGDVSVVRIESKTGNPTDGTVLEVVSHDANVDPLVVTISDATNPLVVTQGGLVNIIGLTGTIDYTDFDVNADGLVTIASDGAGTMITLSPSAGTPTGIDASSTNIGTIALDVGANDIVGTTGLINYTFFDVNADGDVSAVDGTFTGNLSVTGTILMDSVTAKTAATTITVDGTGVGGVTIGGTSTGVITLGGGATEVNLPSTVDLVLAGGDVTVTDTANADMVTFTNNTMTTADLLTLTAGGTRTSDNVIEIADSASTASTVGITANAQTSGNGISYSNSGAALTGSAYYASITDGAGFTGYYFRGYDGAADDFSVKRYGATVIAGNAKGTDALTLTAGDILVSSGHVDMTTGNLTLAEGKIGVDSAADVASNITRNYNGVGTSPVLTVSDDHTASTNTALAINQDGTGNSTGVSIAHDGDFPALAITAGAARTGDVINITMANQLAQQAIDISGAWTGTNGQGLIDLYTSGVIAAGASMLRLDADTAQPADSDGYMMSVDDDTLVVATPSKYAVLIDSNANEALHVATGKSLFDELATFTLGAQFNSTTSFDSATNDIGVDITSTATGGTAGFGIVTIHGDHAGNTNDVALLRLVQEADGDAQDTFILAEDNSTGAAGNGDDKFKVSYNGNTTIGGQLILGTTALSVTTEANLPATLLSSVYLITGDDDADNDTVDLQNGTTAGQLVTFAAVAAVDGTDTVIFSFADTTCSGCAATTFDAIGENVTFVWSGTTWIQTAINTSL